MLLGLIWEAASSADPVLPTVVTINALISFDVFHIEFSFQQFYQLSLYLAASHEKPSKWRLMSCNNSLVTSIF